VAAFDGHTEVAFAEESTHEQPPPAEEHAVEQIEDEAPDRETEEDRPRRGRRRRGRRGRREDRPASRNIEEHTTDREATDDESPFPEESDNGEEEEDAEPVEAQTEEDLDVDNTLRDWNVPSWNELIASLYRPDR
jgi:hypothetical protein